MTATEYIKQKFQTFGINLSEAELLDLCLSTGVSQEDEVSDSNASRISVAMVKFIPSLLLRATSVSESGFSMSWNIDGIKSYYAMMCKEYGLKNELSTRPKVKFI